MRDGVVILSLILMVSLAACDGNLGSVAADDGGTESGEPSESEEGGETLACIGGELCPEGSSCSNGVCETECSDDDDCGTDEYCGLDGLCHPNLVPSCLSDQDCAPTQTCIQQICTATGDGGCDLDNWLIDGCPSNAVCVENEDRAGEGVCYPLPACAEEQTCPIGLEGAVCNTGQLPSKDPICLPGLCATVENCPELWSCVRYDNSVLGQCSNGGFGSACTQNLHCLSGTCVPIPGIGGGICG
jgi:hypothetical protein